MNLNRWLPFIHQSAKQNFHILRENGPYFSKKLEKNIFITKLFFQHIAHSKRRSANLTERVQRLLILSVLPKVIISGNITEEREEKDSTFFRLEKKIFGKLIAVIIIKTSYNKYLLLSCFLVHTKKRLVSSSNAE